MLLSKLQLTIEQLTRGFGDIPSERKDLLMRLTAFIQQKSRLGQSCYLNFICTHNSRRSHMAQLWGQAAAYYYQIPNVICFSGGTEATGFNVRAVEAMKDVGFDIIKRKESDNPVYDVTFADDARSITSFSKRYDDPFNHTKDFAAVMTCSHADQNCPLVLGAEARIAITYEDPKDFDGTEQETAKYKERSIEIGQEILFAFSQVRL